MQSANKPLALHQVSKARCGVSVRNTYDIRVDQLVKQVSNRHGTLLHRRRGLEDDDVGNVDPCANIRTRQTKTRPDKSVLAKIIWLGIRGDIWETEREIIQC